MVTQMKALVLSGGAGPRSRPSTHTLPEQPVPVAHQAVVLPDGPQLIAASETHRVRVIVGEYPSMPVVHDAVRAVEPYRRGELENFPTEESIPAEIISALHALRHGKAQSVS